jgi:DUF1009 family protein
MDCLPPTASTPRLDRIGLLAGAGRLPIAFARAALRRGLRVHAVGISGMASEELRDVCTTYRTMPLGRLGRTIRLMQRARVGRAVMAGKIDKTALFQRFRWIRHLPDWRFLKVLFRHFHSGRDGRDDTLLLTVIREFERDGIQFDSALDYCPELLVQHGFLTRRKPSPAQWRDIRFGWTLAKEIGRLDVGQTVVVNDQAALAIEAIEGTDACIRRAGLLCRRGGFTVVKVAKPQQDMRFDVPTIGLDTIQTMRESGGRVLAIECGQTILLDETEVLRLADTCGIAIVSLKAEELQLRMAS